MIIGRMKVSRVFSPTQAAVVLVLFFASLTVWSSSWLAWSRTDEMGREVPTQLLKGGGGSIDSELLMGALRGGRTVPVAPGVVALSRYRLCGYAATKSSIGAALLSVDGGAPKILLVGREVDELGLLVSLERRGATFSLSADDGRVESLLPLMKCGLTSPAM